MKHEIQNIRPKNFEGKPFYIPVFDSQGKVIYEPVLDKAGKVELAEDGTEIKTLKLLEGSLSDCLTLMVKQFPRELFTTPEGSKKSKSEDPYTPLENATYGNRLCHKIDVDTDETFELGGKTYDWTLYYLKHEMVGLAIFGINVPSLIEALTGESEEDE